MPKVDGLELNSTFTKTTEQNKQTKKTEKKEKKEEENKSAVHGPVRHANKYERLSLFFKEFTSFLLHELIRKL